MTYTSAGETLSFEGYRDLVAGDGTNTFTISGTPTANLMGGAGGDTFQFTDASGTFVVDFVRGASSGNPALAWQPS